MYDSGLQAGMERVCAWTPSRPFLHLMPDSACSRRAGRDACTGTGKTHGAAERVRRVTAGERHDTRSSRRRRAPRPTRPARTVGETEAPASRTIALVT